MHCQLLVSSIINFVSLKSDYSLTFVKVIFFLFCGREGGGTASCRKFSFSGDISLRTKFILKKEQFFSKVQRKIVIAFTVFFTSNANINIWKIC